MSGIKTRSLQTIISVWNLVFIAVVGATALIAMTVLTDGAVRGVIRRDIQSLYSDVRHCLEHEGEEIVLSDEFENDYEGFSYAVYDAEGALLLGEAPEGFVPKHRGEPEERQAVYRVRLGGDIYYIREGEKRLAAGEGKQEMVRIAVFICKREIRSFYRQIQLISSGIILLMAGLYCAATIWLNRKLSRQLSYRMNRIKRIAGRKSLPEPVQEETSFRELEEISSAYDRVLQKMEQVLAQQKQFNRDISHELRTPMAVIKAQCQVTLEKYRSQPDLRERIELILEQTNRMGVLVDSLLELAHLEDANRRLEEEEVDLREVVLSLCEEYEETQGERFALSLEEVELTANMELMVTLVHNLIDNALKYGGDERIEITLRRKADAAELCIRDHGAGISPEDQERIFEPFYRGDRSRTTSGHGLGLTLVRRIASYYQGEVALESAPGEGSRFTVTLPLIRNNM